MIFDFTLVIYQAVIDVNKIITAVENTVINTDNPKAEINPVFSIPLI